MQDRHIEKMVGDLSAIFDIDVNGMGIGGIRQGIHADTFTCPQYRDLVDMTVYRAEVDGDTFAALDQSQEFWIYAIRRA